MKNALLFKVWITSLTISILGGLLLFAVGLETIGLFFLYIAIFQCLLMLIVGLVNIWSDE